MNIDYPSTFTRRFLVVRDDVLSFARLLPHPSAHFEVELAPEGFVIENAHHETHMTHDGHYRFAVGDPRYAGFFRADILVVAPEIVNSPVYYDVRLRENHARRILNQLWTELPHADWSKLTVSQPCPALPDGSRPNLQHYGAPPANQSPMPAHERIVRGH